MGARDQQLGWIGALGGLIGVVILNVAPLDALLPINRTLFALICGLLCLWVLAVLTKLGSSE